jgi:hypothetical protein
VLAVGEMAVDTTLNQFKIGDGISAWNDLQFVKSSTVVSDGNKGDITISGGVWSIDSSAPNIVNKAIHFSTRNDLASTSTSNSVAILSEINREGIFVFDSSDHSAHVTADPNQGIYIAPTSDTTGASGAWVRKKSGPIYSNWFGSGGAGITAAVAFAQTQTGSNITGYGGAAPEVRIPFSSSVINMTSTLSITTAGMRIVGEGGAAYGRNAVVLKWPAGMNGIELHVIGCTIEGLALQGGWVSGTSTEGEYHAIKAYYTFTARDLFIQNWQGDGIHSWISSGSGGDTEGIDNTFYIDHVAMEHCRNGVFLKGEDVNAGTLLALNINYCRQAAIWDEAFLGNTHMAHQLASCGTIDVGTNGVPYIACFNNGHLFYCVYGQETGASTNSPPSTATDNTWWHYWTDIVSAPSYAPQWTSGMSIRSGGAAIVQGPSTLLNCYTEGDQPPPQTGATTVVINGLNAYKDTFTRYVAADTNGLKVGNNLYVNGSFIHNYSGEFRVDGSINGATQDPLIKYNTGNLYTQINFNASNGTTYADILAYSTLGMFYDIASAAQAHYFRIAGSTIVDIENGGLNLASGKVLKVNGTQVVTARQANITQPTGGTTIDTQARAAINSILTLLQTHGLMS